MPGGRPFGRMRAQRWSGGADAESGVRRDAEVQAELRLLHDELAGLKAIVQSGASAPPPLQHSGERRDRTLGRGLDALLSREGSRWWDTELPPNSPPGEQLDTSK